MNTNAEIAARLELKPHTIGQWRRQEDWDGLRLKIDKRAAALLVEKIATDPVNLNLKHFKYWDVLLSRIAEAFKKPNREEVRDLEGLSAILDRAQKGQRLPLRWRRCAHVKQAAWHARLGSGAEPRGSEDGRCILFRGN